jgi:hypothetical protein
MLLEPLKQIKYFIHTNGVFRSGVRRDIGKESWGKITASVKQEGTDCKEIKVRAKGKGKAVPLQAWSGPEGSRKLRFPDYMTTAQDSGKVVSLTHRPPLPPGNVPGTHFCQRLSRPQGHSAIGRIMSMENKVRLEFEISGTQFSRIISSL